MTTQITIEVSDTLAERLRLVKDRLPEVLERGLHEISSENGDLYQDTSGIIAVLTSQPTPQQILSLRPTSQLQARVSDLLARSKTNELSLQEERELERYLWLEHIVRLAKANAAKWEGKTKNAPNDQSYRS